MSELPAPYSEELTSIRETIDWFQPEARPPFQPTCNVFAGGAIWPLFETIAKTYPDHPATVGGSRRITFLEIHRLARCLALALDRIAPSGAPVVVLPPRTPAGLAAILASVAAARVCLLVNPNDPPARVAATLTNAGAAAAIIPDETFRALLPESTAILLLDAFGLPSSDPQGDLPPPAAPDAPCFVTFTSGSTGRPKGIVLSQAGVLRRAGRQVEGWDLTAADRLVAVTPPTAGSGLCFALACLMTGAAQCAFDLVGEGARAMLDLAKAERLTILVASPPVLRLLLALPGAEQALASVRITRSSADALLRADAEKMREKLPGSLLETTYASTEALLVAVWMVPTDYVPDGERLPCGYPLPEFQLRILADDGRPAGPGEPGELIVRGRYVALGEWQNGRVIPGRMQPDPEHASWRIFKTGDIVRLGGDGLLRLLGRADRQVKIRGLRVEPLEVEQAIRGVPGVSEAVIVVWTAGETTQMLGFVTLRDGEDVAATTAAIRADLAARFPPAMRPNRTHVIAAIPRLPIGKPDQEALLTLDRDLAAGR